jgi:hypothetical protein
LCIFSVNGFDSISLSSSNSSYLQSTRQIQISSTFTRTFSGSPRVALLQHTLSANCDMAKGLQNLSPVNQQRVSPVLVESPRFSSGSCRRESVASASSWQGRDSVYYVQSGNDNSGVGRSSVLANLMSLTSIAGSNSGIDIVSGPSNLAQQFNPRNFGL